jgi:hypothetical protein
MAKTIANNNYVIVQNNVVISLFEGSQLPEYNEEMIEVIDVTDVDPKPEMNWVYNSGVFTTPNLGELSELTGKDKLKFERGLNLTKPITFMGRNFKINSGTYSSLIGYVTYLNTFGVLPSDFVWTDELDEPVAMTPDEMKQFFKIAIERVLSEHLIYIEGKKQL